MSAITHIADRAAGLASLAVDDPERIEALAHVKICERCAHAWTEAQGVMSLLDALPAPEHPSPASLQRVSQALLLELDTAAQRFSVAVPASVALVGVLATLLAKHHSPDPEAWMWAAVVAIGAVVCGVFAQRAALAAGAGGFALSAFTLLAAGRAEGELSAAGLDCLGVELLSAAVPSLVLAYVADRRGTRATASSYAAVALSGGLAAQGALHLTCAAHEVLSHLLVFHLGGLALAAGMAVWASRRFALAA